MIRSILLLGTTGFWLTMMSLLIGKEFFQIAPVQMAYDVLPITSSGLRRDDYGIFLGNKRIGLSFLKLQPDAEEEGFFEQQLHTYMSFFLLGNRIEMLIRGKAQLDSQLYLRKFAIRITSADYQTELQGEVIGTEIRLEIKEKGSPPVQRVIPLKGPVLFSESLDLIWTPKNLIKGKQGQLQIFNPLMANVESIQFRVGDKEILSYEAAEKEAFVVYLKKGEIETRYWVTPEGVTLKKESHTGLLFKREEAWKLYEAMRTELTSPPDLPHLYSIPSNLILEHPDQIHHLRVKIKTKNREDILDIRKENLLDLEEYTLPVPLPNPEFMSYLKPTPSVQSDAEEIKEMARQIIDNKRSAFEASLALMDWVHVNVIPVPTVSIPSALQVLSVRKGDCNEYTVLFTALARSAGIPTKMVAGLVYYKGRFFYHAWPEIYLGRWIGLDPTLNQVPTDATHIPLVEGSLQEQMDLLTNLGQIKVVILETDEKRK